MSALDARAFIRRRINGTACLVPADIHAEDFLEGVREGREVLVRIDRPRNVRHHRMLFALLRKVVDNSERWADEETLLADLKLATGLFETRVSALTGLPYPVPASISFASMDQARFSAWFDKAVAVLARDVLNIAPEALRAEIEDMVNPARRAA